jgi:hypothetical protein
MLLVLVLIFLREESIGGFIGLLVYTPACCWCGELTSFGNGQCQLVLLLPSTLLLLIPSKGSKIYTSSSHGFCLNFVQVSE